MTTDLDGKLRILEGVVYIGAYEFSNTCIGDFVPTDGDVDGSNLAELAANPYILDLSVFASEFGRNDCW